MRVPSLKPDKEHKEQPGEKQAASREFRDNLNELKGKLKIIKGNKNIFILGVLLIVSLSAIFALSFNWSPAANTTGSTEVSSTTLATTNDSTVVKEGPYGNTSSNITVAYIVGVHPRESASHQAIIESIHDSDSSLEKRYYLYIINAPLYQNNYPQERMNGQLLTNKYVVPDIINNNYQLAVDVHSSNGSYPFNRFIFAPARGNKSISIALELEDKISWLKYYYPPNPSSIEYVTLPLIQNGIPSIVYEAYKDDSNTTTKEHAREFIKVIDTSQLWG